MSYMKEYQTIKDMTNDEFVHDLKVYSLVSSSIYPSEAYTRVFARREDALKAFAEERQYALDSYPEATIHDDHENVFYLDDEGSDVLLHLEIHESTIQ